MIVTERRTTPMGRPTKINVLEARFHRNGVGGEGFYAIRFHKHRKPEPELFAILTVTGDDDSRGFCGVISASGNVKERWRGADAYEAALREAIYQLSDQDMSSTRRSFGSTESSHDPLDRPSPSLRLQARRAGTPAWNPHRLRERSPQSPRGGEAVARPAAAGALLEGGSVAMASKSLKRKLEWAQASFALRPMAYMHTRSFTWWAGVYDHAGEPRDRKLAACSHHHHSRTAAMRCAKQLLNRVVRERLALGEKQP